MNFIAEDDKKSYLEFLRNLFKVCVYDRDFADSKVFERVGTEYV